MDIHSNAKPFEFRGQAGEWFGIWIVNLLLSIVTIGIYSAWAKVRTKKYFYNNTFVEGRNFDYHATGKQILIGRVIVVVGYIIFNIVAQLSPVIGGIAVLLLLAALPWLLVRSMMFNARMSSFSNVRFRFTGKYWGALWVYIALPFLFYILIIILIAGGVFIGAESGSVVLGGALGVLGVFIMFAAFPIIDRMIKAFSINNHLLGTAEFQINTTVGPFIKAGVLAGLWVVAVLAVGAVLFGAQTVALIQLIDGARGGQPPTQIFGLIGLLYFIMFAAFLPATFIYQAIVRNVVYNNASLSGGHRFHSNVSAGRMLWIAVSNMVVVICTLFLMLPWAQIRLAKYLANHTYLLPGSSLDEFIGGQMDQSGAVGDAFSDLEGFDVGLPL